MVINNVNAANLAGQASTGSAVSGFSEKQATETAHVPHDHSRGFPSVLSCLLTFTTIAGSLRGITGILVIPIGRERGLGKAGGQQEPAVRAFRYIQGSDDKVTEYLDTLRQNQLSCVVSLLESGVGTILIRFIPAIQAFTSRAAFRVPMHFNPRPGEKGGGGEILPSPHVFPRYKKLTV